MQAESFFLEAPLWPRYSRRRLRVSLMLATIVVATILAVLRMPLAGQAPQVTELLVTVIIKGVESLAPEPASGATGETAVADDSRSASPAQSDGRPEEPVDLPDWYAEIPAAVQAALDDASRIYAVNPAFEARRREAAVKFAPSKAKPPKPVWENVERDVMGRSILWSGDCYRVIDDPNAGSREAFETFGQYITSCMNWTDRPKELPWVSEIRNRRAARAQSGRPAAE